MQINTPAVQDNMPLARAQLIWLEIELISGCSSTELKKIVDGRGFHEFKINLFAGVPLFSQFI